MYNADLKSIIQGWTRDVTPKTETLHNLRTQLRGVIKVISCSRQG